MLVFLWKFGYAKLSKMKLSKDLLLPKSIYPITETQALKAAK